MKTEPIIKDFHFNAVLLAAKHWYVRREDESLIDFFLRLIKIDDQYIVTENKERDAKRFCIMILDELSQAFRKNNVISWWDNYTTYTIEIENYEYLYKSTNVEAHILFVFNILMKLNPIHVSIRKPIYGKGYPRLSNETGMTYKEMSRRASKMFGEQ